MYIYIGLGKVHNGPIFSGDSLENSAIEVTSSSVHGSNPIARATNKINNDAFVSGHEIVPWIQWEFDGYLTVTRVIVVQRLDCCAERFANVHFHLGNNSAIVGQVNDNPRCGVFDGPGATGGVDVILCKKNMNPGKYFAFQRILEDDLDFGFSEIVIHGY